MAAKQREHAPDPEKFDLRTHYWNGQGQLEKKNLYTCYVIDGSSYYERPVGSGNIWLENNQPGGRVSMVNGQPKIDPTAKHIDFSPKLEGNEAIAYELEMQRQKNVELEAELASIRAERAPKSVEVKSEEAPKAPTLTKRSQA